MLRNIHNSRGNILMALIVTGSIRQWIIYMQYMCIGYKYYVCKYCLTCCSCVYFWLLSICPDYHIALLRSVHNSRIIIMVHTGNSVAVSSVMFILITILWVVLYMWPDLRKLNIIVHTKIFSIKHYNTLVQKTYFIKYLRWLYESHNLAILTPIRKPW